MENLFYSVISNYLNAYKEDYNNHPLANIIRKEIPQEITKIIPDNVRYIIKGSAGLSKWTATPWIAIFDSLITESAQSGYYPVFLFCDDMSGFYLSLNQGVTEIKQKYKRDAKHVLQLKAEDFRAQMHSIPNTFPLEKITLKRLNKDYSGLSTFYEAGNIVAKYYPASDLPDTNQLVTDIINVLTIYKALYYNEFTPPSSSEIDSEEQKFEDYEELKRFRFHKRLERNNKLSKKVKALQGYTCKACGINFELKYGELGKAFIEAHHMIPLSRLQGERILLNAKTDFTVLCSNCHSMIHRLDDPSNLVELKSRIIY